MTDNAATEIRNLVDSPDIPDAGGVRIASDGDGALTLALAAQPIEGDQVLDDRGARVFLEPSAGQLLHDKELDAETDPQGNVRFSIGQQA